MNIYRSNKLLLTLSAALVLSTCMVSETRAATCEFKTDPNNEGKYTLYVKGDDGGSAFTTSSCTNIPNGQSWSKIISKITSASFDSNVTSIGESAFEKASSLQSIDMPNVTSIGKSAFQEASSLQSVDMPNVTSIGALAFYSASLQGVDMPNVTSIEYEAFYWATKLQSVDLSKVTSIGDYAFSYAPSLTNIIIPDDVNVNNWSAKAFGGSFTNNEDSIITCLGDIDTCKTELSKKYGEAIVNKVQPASDTQCNSSVNYYYSTNDVCVKLPTTQETCTGSNIEWDTDNAKCVKKAITAPTTPNEGTQGGTSGDSGGSGGSQESDQQGTQVSGQAISAADCAASGKYWQEGKCVSSCSASFKLNDGWCDRQRYTPAEAAAILNDDDNTITITFKK